MRISQLICELEQYYYEVGDVEVQVCNQAGDLDYVQSIGAFHQQGQTLLEISVKEEAGS